VDLYYQRSGVLGAPVRISHTAQASQVEIADVNHDGRKDVVVSTLGGILLARNTGAGFAVRPISTQYCDEIEVADVTGDGRLDVVGYNDLSLEIFVFRRLASGGFSGPARYAIGDDPWGIAVGDLTGDGRNDIAASIPENRPYGRMLILPQKPDGRLGAPVLYPTYDLAAAVEAADLSGDGVDELVVAHLGWDQASIYRQRADRTLGAERLYRIPYGDFPQKSIAIGDISGDGLPDIALADGGAWPAGLVVLRQIPRRLHVGAGLNGNLPH